MRGCGGGAEKGRAHQPHQPVRLCLHDGPTRLAKTEVRTKSPMDFDCFAWSIGLTSSRRLGARMVDSGGEHRVRQSLAAHAAAKEEAGHRPDCRIIGQGVRQRRGGSAGVVPFRHVARGPICIQPTGSPP
jgi:hypothetical protein